MSSLVIHTIVSVEPFAATESGALSGHMATCSCGDTIKTSLSADQALREGEGHTEFYNGSHGINRRNALRQYGNGSSAYRGYTD